MGAAPQSVSNRPHLPQPAVRGGIGENARGVEAAHGDAVVGGDAAGDLQGEVAPATDAQEGGEVGAVAAGCREFVVEAADELTDAHGVARTDLFEDIPEQDFEPDAGRDAVQAQRPATGAVQLRVRADENLAHDRPLSLD